MAFHDILRALNADADKRIAAAHEAKRAALAETRARLGRAADEKIAFIESECERKKKNMERQVSAHALMTGRQAVMKAKHALMEETYDRALDLLSGMDASKTEAFLRRLIDSCPEGGTIRPAEAHAATIKKIAGGRAIGEPVKSRGGFIHESETSERNFTYEVLVRDILRPATELSVAGTLFPAKA